MIRSANSARLAIATMNGELFRSTDATAAPARSVATLIATWVIVVLPSPIRNAHRQCARVRGRRLPNSGSTSVRTSPPSSARSVAIMIGVVESSANAVTG